MARSGRRKRRKPGRGRRGRPTPNRLRLGVWFLGSVAFLVGGLVVGGQLFDGPDGERPVRSLDRAPAGEEGAAPPSTWDRIRVEVLNGGGVPGMAARVRDGLRDRGFDVVYYGNAASFDHDVTRVLARTGSLAAARAVADALGAAEVAEEPDSTLFVDVTVVLGSDWTGETLAEPDPSENEDDEADRSWWDRLGPPREEPRQP